MGRLDRGDFELLEQLEHYANDDKEVAMERNIIKFNISKLERGGLLCDMYDQFNARVGDQGTPLVIQWTQGTTDTPISLKKNQLHFYATGQVGNYLEKLDDGTGYKMSADASSVEYEDKDSAGTQVNGITVAKLPKQFFPQEGIFYGYFGLKDASGNTYTSTNVWFRVLGGVPIMGAAIPYFSTRFDELMETCQGRIEDALAQLRQEYQDEVKKNKDMSTETRAALSKLADAAGAIQAQIDAGNVITRKEYNDLAKKIDNRLSNMKQSIESFANLDDLKARYPNGKDGVFVTNDNNHKYQYKNGAWVDEGTWTVTTFDPEVRRRLTYLDASDEVTKRALQAMTDQVVDLQWFVGSIDEKTGIVTPKDNSMFAYSSLKALGGLRAFEINFDSKVISGVEVLEYSSDGKFITCHGINAGGAYSSSDSVSAVRFQIYKTDGLMGQNDLRDLITNGNLKIIAYGARSVINDINYFYHLNGFTPLTATQGKTIDTNVDYGEKVDTSKLNDAANYQVIKSSCSPGDIFTVSELHGGVNALGWAFLDKDGNLLGKSGVLINQVLTTLYAPCDATTLIVNSTSPSTTVYQYAPDPDRLKDINIADGANINHNITLALRPGEVVSLKPEVVPNYRYKVFSCKPNDKFKIRGAGGINPRLYGFLTADNRLLSVAQSNLDASNGLYIKAPALAAKLVVNFRPDSEHSELYKLPDDSVIETSSSFNQLATPPIDTRMSSYLNGIKLGKDLSTHLADFAKAGDKMVHVSTFYKVGDTLYMSYYANTRTTAEDPTQHTARLVYAPFNDLSQQTYIDVADIGQEYNGQTIDAIYDSLLLKTSADSYMIYAFTAKVGGKFYMLYRRFDPKTKLLSDIHTMNFKAGVLSGTFDTVSVHDLLAQIGVDYNYEDRDISFIQKLSPRVEDGVTQYYTGIGILHMCFIVKSSDLINWTFVSAPDFKYKPEFEPSVYVKGDCVYYFCRQRGTEGDAVLAKFDLVAGTWSKPILVPDTQSRYDFFEDNDQLYLVHSPLDRNYISLMQIDQNILEKSYEVATAKVQDCFYPFTQNIDGQMYMSFTQSRQHIWLNKFSPTYYSNDEVANFFSKITE
ncbi:hypothetical protein SAMN05216430_10867 [Limosilactobacillus mucosae]|nr:hypothetical protein SAMN05216430_10867 [Limosilactobacillus mucosae]SEL10143.1 hypothetical protein SAMN05216545_10934 [Limosilactobacillus mucosae]SFK23435.1 hypothetical protein SAMN05216461_10834 [Limosilactobacillus mucosae]